jgi:arylsulfatase
MPRRPWVALGLALAIIVVTCAFGRMGWAADAKPNILVIWGDDIGWFNTSA